MHLHLVVLWQARKEQLAAATSTAGEGGTRLRDQLEAAILSACADLRCAEARRAAVLGAQGARKYFTYVNITTELLNV